MDVIEVGQARRPETRAVVEAAFETADEARLVDALRATDRYEPRLDLAAVLEGDVLGHLAFTRLAIPGTARPDGHLVLAPVAVRPSLQGEGLGTALVREGLDRAKDLGYGSVLLHGWPRFYRRFGFERAGRFGLENPFDLPDEDFMALELRAGALAGAAGPVDYPGPFEAL